MRRAATASLLALALAAGSQLLPSSDAGATGVEAGVASVISLSLEQVSPSRIRATLTTTVPHTGLSAGRPGTAAVLDTTFRQPVTGRHVGIAVDPGDGVLVVTAGPQTP